jgi:hypothetical protein
VTTVRVQLAPAVTAVRDGESGIPGGGVQLGAPHVSRSGAVTLRLAHAARIGAALYDAAGRRVASFAERAASQGVVRLDATGTPRTLARGVYVLRLVADGQALARTVAVL